MEDNIEVLRKLSEDQHYNNSRFRENNLMSFKYKENEIEVMTKEKTLLIFVKKEKKRFLIKRGDHYHNIKVFKELFLLYEIMLGVNIFEFKISYNHKSRIDSRILILENNIYFSKIVNNETIYKREKIKDIIDLRVDEGYLSIVFNSFYIISNDIKRIDAIELINNIKIKQYELNNTSQKL